MPASFGEAVVKIKLEANHQKQDLVSTQEINIYSINFNLKRWPATQQGGYKPIKCQSRSPRSDGSPSGLAADSAPRVVGPSIVEPPVLIFTDGACDFLS